MTPGLRSYGFHFSTASLSRHGSRSRRTFSREFCWSRPALCHQRRRECRARNAPAEEYGLPGAFKQAALATALFVARVARLAWKAGVVPHTDGVTESRIARSKHQGETTWDLMQEST